MFNSKLKKKVISLEKEQSFLIREVRRMSEEINKLKNPALYKIAEIIAENYIIELPVFSDKSWFYWVLDIKNKFHVLISQKRLKELQEKTQQENGEVRIAQVKDTEKLDS